MRKVFAVAVISLLMLGLSFTGEAPAAGKYPVKPITFIVPVEAGADADVLCRPLLRKASEILGQSIMVVNKPGAGMTVGYREIFGAKPDGYTIGVATSTLITNKLQGLLPFDYHAITPICTYATIIPIIFASTKTPRPFKTIEEVISFAKQKPEDISIAAPSVGGAWWIAAMAFQKETGLKFNIIPQTGAGAMIVAQVAGGHTDLGLATMGAAQGQTEAGNLRPLAIFADKRVPGKYRNIPTLKESGYNLVYHSTQMIIGPPKLPKDISDKLIEVFKKAADDAEYQNYVIERNAAPFYLPPDEVVKFCDEQRKIMRPILAEAGILKDK